jgi:hypothetical protein
LYSPYDYFPVLLGLALGIVFAVFFYRVGEIEYEKGSLFCLASLAITLIVSFWSPHSFCFSPGCGSSTSEEASSNKNRPPA